MSKYNKEKSAEWYQKNRDRLLIVRREYNKKKYSDPNFRESERLRNQNLDRKNYRKNYKKTKAGIDSNKKYRSKPEVKVRYEEYRIRVRYGITTKEYWDLVSSQRGVCAICGENNGKKLHIDHDHKSGVVRGLLCGKCNRGIGLFKDSTDLILKALKYLKKCL